jgi:hypothetical protein
MAEQSETPDIATDDAEGHFRKTAVDGEDGEDTEGHFRKTAVDGEDGEDTEGHFRRT